MLEWLWKHTPAVRIEAPPTTLKAPKRQTRGMDGKYLLLNEYLENRFANTVVLTFGQIEDLVGSALPDVARTDKAWWTVDAAAGGSRHQQAWTLARMTAKPNLLAQNVVFERAP